MSGNALLPTGGKDIPLLTSGQNDPSLTSEQEVSSTQDDPIWGDSYTPEIISTEKEEKEKRLTQKKENKPRRKSKNNKKKKRGKIKKRPSKKVRTKYSIIQSKNLGIIPFDCTVRFSEQEGVKVIPYTLQESIRITQRNILSAGSLVSILSVGEFLSKEYEKAGYKLALHLKGKKNKLYIPDKIELVDDVLWSLQKRINSDLQKRMLLAALMVSRYISLSAPILQSYSKSRLPEDFIELNRDIMHYKNECIKGVENLISKKRFVKKDFDRLRQIESVFSENVRDKVIDKATYYGGPQFRRTNYHDPKRPRKLARKKFHLFNKLLDRAGHDLFDTCSVKLTFKGLDPNSPTLHQGSGRHDELAAGDIVDFSRTLIWICLADLFRENGGIHGKKLSLFNRIDVVKNKFEGKWTGKWTGRFYKAYYDILEMPDPFFPNISVLDSFDAGIDFLIENMKKLDKIEHLI